MTGEDARRPDGDEGSRPGSEPGGAEEGGASGAGPESSGGEVGPEPEDAPARVHAPGETHICEVCGAPMIERHCKITCTVCGYQRDCSDP